MHSARKNAFVALVGAAFLACPALTHTAKADSSTRFGLWNALDSSSKYNSNFFPEPLLADEMDADQEVRFGWVHAEKPGHRTDEVFAEVEATFNLLTVEVEVPYEHERETENGVTEAAEGVGSIELAARHPFFQYVPGNGFDLTLGARVELAIASTSDVSRDNEVVAGVYDVMAFGDRLSLQVSAGYSKLFGPEDGGDSALEYAAVLGYNLDFKTDWLTRITPVVEIDGETGLSHQDQGDTELTGVIGGVFAFSPNRYVLPKWTIGYIVPLDDNARDEFHWGVVTSFIFEY